VIAPEAAGEEARDYTPRSPQAQGWVCLEKDGIPACSRTCRVNARG